MGLKATRNRGNAQGGNAQPQNQEAPQEQAQPQQQAQPQTQAQPQQQAQPQTPAPQQQGGAPAPSGGGNAIESANAGVLDNIEGMGSSGNFVTMDGSDFLYKASNETAKEIDIVIHYGKRFYQWYDEDNQQYNNSDHKVDDRYKMKFEIRWNEIVDEEASEHIMTLPTSSAMSFVDYIKKLAQDGLGVDKVVTRMTISRQHNQQMNIRYSRTEFENLGLAQ